MSHSTRRVRQHASVVALVLAASLGATFANAAPSAYTAPESRVMDSNGVDLVSGQYTRSDTFLTIGNPSSGGLAWTYTGHPEVDNYTGELHFIDAASPAYDYYIVKIAGSSEQIKLPSVGSVSETGTKLEDTTSYFLYTARDGTVYTFDKLTITNPTYIPVRKGKLISIAKPNGDVVTINHEYDPGCAANSQTCNYRIKSVVSNRGFAFKYEYEAANFSRLDVIRAVNRADTYCDDQINSCLAWHNAITFDYPNSGLTFKVTDAMGNSTEYGVTDSNIPEVEVINYVKQADGWTINATYDVYGRITSLTNPEATWNYTYNDNTQTAINNTSQPRVVTLKDSSNATVMSASVHKGVMLPMSVTVDGKTTNYTLLQQQNSYGKKWGRITEKILPEGNKESYTYDARGNVTSVTHTPKSGSGLSAFTVNANYDSTCTNFKTCNKPNWTQDGRGNYTSYTYSGTHGGLETTTLPADSAGVTPKTINTYQQFTAQKKDSGNALVDDGTVWLLRTTSTCSTAVTCDGTVNQLKTTTDYYTSINLVPYVTSVATGDNSLSATTGYGFDWIGNVTAVDGPLSGTSDMTYKTYDANRRPVFEIGVDPDDGGALVRSMVKHSYDSMGRETQTEIGTGASVTGGDFAGASYVVTHYNARGLKDQVTSYIHGNGTPQTLSQFSYDNQGRQICTAVRMNMGVTPPADPCALGTEGAFGPDRITKNIYDTAGRITEVKRALNITTANGFPQTLEQSYVRYTYTNNGLKATEKDANGNLTTLEYDGFDRLKKLRYPNTTIASGTSSTTDYEQYDYDNNGNRTYWRRRDGQVMNDCYDNLNRVTVHYVHAQTGCTATGGAADVYTTYDLTGKILSKRFASTSGSGVSYIYDGLGRLNSSADMNGRTVGYAYNAASARISVIHPDLNTVGYGLDNANRLISVGWNMTTGLLTQNYDNLGRLSGQGKAGGSTSWTYDGTSRLASMTNDVAGTSYDVTWSFGYNPAGQIVSSGNSSPVYDYKELSGATTNRTYDGLNRDTGIVSVGGYDARGNLTYEGSGGRTMTYDIENRLLTVNSSSTNMVLNYDPEGRLYRYSVDGGSTWRTFLYDGVNLIGEYAGTAALPDRRYIHGTGTDNPLLFFIGSGTADIRWMYTNYQGSLVMATGGVGNMTDFYKYGPYGEPKDLGNNDNWVSSRSRFGYTGQTVLPEAKLYYYKARVYDPQMGRFLQTDPIGSADDLNLYAYTAGDPVNNTDPFGLMGMDNSAPNTTCPEGSVPDSTGECVVVVTSTKNTWIVVQEPSILVNNRNIDNKLKLDPLPVHDCKDKRDGICYIFENEPCPPGWECNYKSNSRSQYLKDQYNECIKSAARFRKRHPIRLDSLPVVGGWLETEADAKDEKECAALYGKW